MVEHGLGLGALHPGSSYMAWACWVAAVPEIDQIGLWKASCFPFPKRQLSALGYISGPEKCIVIKCLKAKPCCRSSEKKKMGTSWSKGWLRAPCHRGCCSCWAEWGAFQVSMDPQQSDTRGSFTIAQAGPEVLQPGFGSPSWHGWSSVASATIPSPLRYWLEGRPCRV